MPLEEIVEVTAVSLVIAQRGEERGLPQQVLFNVEEDRPQRGFVPVGHEVAGVHYEVRDPVFEHCLDDAAVHVVAGARIAED